MVTGADERCACGAALASDQRYCLACGAATARAASLRAAAFGGGGAEAPLAHGLSVGAADASAAGTTLPAAGRVRLPGFAREFPAGAATAVFAIVLGTSAWAGARVTAAPLPPAPIYAYAAAPAPGPGAPAASALPAAPAGALAAGDDAVSDLIGDGSALPAGGDATALATPAATPAPNSAPADSADPAPTDEDAPTPEAIAPTRDRVVVVSLPQLPYDALADPAGPAPYLAGELAKQGTLLRGFTATSASVLASRIALLTGQAPNSATLDGCPATAPLAPGTLGADDQAAGSGCLYSADVFAAGDLLASSDRDWRVYASTPGADCAPLPADAPWPADRPVPLLLGAFTGQPACAERLAPLRALANDLRADRGPALSYVQLDAPDPLAVDQALRELMPEVLAALRSATASAVMLVPSASPQGGADADRSACCARPWITDQATGGGGRTGALVISSAAQAGAVIDGAVDHYDVLKTISVALGVRPLGYAARDEVTGLPAELWQRNGVGAP